MVWVVIAYMAVFLFVLFAVMEIAALIKRPDSVFSDFPAAKNPMEGKKVVFTEDEHDPENADGKRGHLTEAGPAEKRKNPYARTLKRFLDMLISFFCLVVLSPVFLVLILAVKIDDPGPAFFVQKRVGKNKRYFKLHKFRSMKMCTPHDRPTHMLENPEQYITGVGKFIRAHSLDELPQIWDIFLGNMSFVGPRPALWNQDCLIAERDKYGANGVTPGLTGLAQINGRDELSIEEKARLDGEYVKRQSFATDFRCFFGTVHVLKKDDSIVEGGPAEKKKKSAGNKETVAK